MNQQPPVTQPQALVDALAAQRNEAMNQVAQTQAALAVCEAERQRLTARNAELEKRLAELEPPPPDDGQPAQPTEAR